MAMIDLPPEFWEAFALTKEPGEHMHTLPGGGRVYCHKVHDEVWCTHCEREAVTTNAEGEALCAVHLAWSADRITHDEEVTAFSNGRH